MSDNFEGTSLFRRFRATPSARDPNADKLEVQETFEEVLSQLGTRAPAPEPNESEGAYLARLGDICAVFGPEERKRVDRSSLPSAALAEFVRQDLEIARQEVERPNYTLKEGVLTERRKSDESGREFIEFYSKSGPSIWMKDFEPPTVAYVSCGSQGFATPDTPRSDRYSFHKGQTVPELVAIQQRADYEDSAEYKIAEAYRAVGLEPPENAMQQFRAKMSY
jgi:hypothetical protein